MSIEDVAHDTPEKIHTFTVDPATGLQDFHGRRVAVIAQPIEREAVWRVAIPAPRTLLLVARSGAPSSYVAQDICYIVFANENNDVATCNKVKTPDLKSECYSELAVKGGGADVCDGAPADAKDRCYSQIVEKLGDVKVCERIKISNDRDNCIANYASRIGDGALCEKIINVNQRDSCYINTARNNPALCNEILNPNTKQDCLRNIAR